MLTSEIEINDTHVAMDNSTGKSWQPHSIAGDEHTPRILVLSEDAQEREQLSAWAGPLNAHIEFVGSGKELLASLTKPMPDGYLARPDHEPSTDLIVLGCQLPSWVYLDLIDRIKLRVNPPGSNGSSRKAPSFLLLLTPQTIDEVFEHISTSHLDLKADFVERPVRAAEFCVRAKRLLRQPKASMGVDSDSSPEPQEPMDTSSLNAISMNPVGFGPYEFDFKRHSVSLQGELIRLSYREFALTWMLFSKMGHMVPRAQLLQRLFMRAGPEVSSKHSRSLDSYICRIRHDLKMTPENGYALEAVYGQGYVVRPV